VHIFIIVTNKRCRLKIGIWR